jgi:hypothetical protein
LSWMTPSVCLMRAGNLTRRPGVLECSEFQSPFAIHPKSCVRLKPWRQH